MKNEMKIKENGMRLTVLLGLMLMLSFSSALELGEGCCFLKEDGNNCGITESDGCTEGFAEGVECALSASCEKGCCYDEESGTYDTNVLKSDCDAAWDDDESCDLPGNRLGCCLLDSRNVFENYGQCATDSVVGVGSGDVNWDPSVGRVGCVISMGDQREGACVFENGECTFGNEEWCLNNFGRFAGGVLCTSPNLNTSYKMTERTQCFDEKVYFVDSDGNRGNVYDADRVDDASYWDSVVAPASICGYENDTGNANSASCGNCDRLSGGVCASALYDNFNVDYGNFYCKDTSCMFEGERYKDGESWCIYDGAIGNGDDVVGSRHWNYVCSQGVVQIEPCEEKRNEICVQSDTYEIDGDDVDFRSASCVANNWADCLYLNTEEGDIEDCDETDDCFTKNVSIGAFNFNICTPKYPVGFDWTNDADVDNAEDICGLASQSCVATYQKNWKFEWECVHNCECETVEFTKEMNDLCKSMGDCGAYVNIAGDITDDGYGVDADNGDDLTLSDDYLTDEYGSKNEPVDEQFARRENYSLGGTGALMAILQGSDSYDTFAAIDPIINIVLWSPAAVAGYFGEDEDTARTLDAVGHWVMDELYGDTKEKTVEFSCEPWSPPSGGDSCESCNGNLLKPCSPYRCHSLGATCEFLNGGSDNEICINGGVDDGIPSILVNNDEVLSEGIEYTDVSDAGSSLVSEDDECLPAYTGLTFGVLTDKPSHCKYDTEMKDFEHMGFNLGSSLWSYNHTTTFVLPDLSHGVSQGADWNGDFAFYIKCVNYNGHETPRFYTIDMCLYEGDDTFSPVTVQTTPEDNTLVGFDSDFQDFDIVLNEPATCKWDDADVAYDSMGNEMECDENIWARSSPFGYVCSDDLPIVNASNVYYIRCMDQPWLANINDRNVDMDSFVLNLNKPASKISIDKISPNSDFKIGSSSTTRDLKVGTSGGGSNHVCSASLTGYSGMFEMLKTGNRGTHEQPSLNLGPGKQKIFIECKDETGDVNRSMVEFNIVRDSSAPQVARVWQDGGRLNLVTLENSECKYSVDTCRFDWGDGDSAGGGTDHSISVVQGETYYVKCADEFGNMPNGCSVEVTAT